MACWLTCLSSSSSSNSILIAELVMIVVITMLFQCVCNLFVCAREGGILGGGGGGGVGEIGREGRGWGVEMLNLFIFSAGFCSL